MAPPGFLYLKALVQSYCLKDTCIFVRVLPYSWELSLSLFKRGSKAQCTNREERINGQGISTLSFATFLKHSLSKYKMDNSPQFFLDLSCWKKTSISDTLKKYLWVARDFLVSHSWILPGSLGCKASSALLSESPRPWLSGLSAGLSAFGKVSDDSAVHHATLSRAQQKGTSCSVRTTESSCRSPLMWLWQENNFQNVLQPQAPLK